MPNWCDNAVEISHDDPVMMKHVIDAWNSENFMQTLHPCPKDLKETMAGYSGDPEKQKENEAREASNREKYGYANWYDWQVANWGTKWDVDTNNYGKVAENGKSLGVNFQTAWSPPINFYEYLANMNYKVEASYYESGMGFCGSYSSENGEDYYEIKDFTSKWVKENIPASIDEDMGISENLAELEE